MKFPRDTAQMPESDPPLFRRIDSLIRGMANTMTFGYADEIAGYVDSWMFGGTSEDHIARERAETLQRRSEGPEERIGEVIGVTIGAAKIAKGVGLVTGSTRLVAAGTIAETPVAMTVAGARSAVTTARWILKAGLKAIKWGGITAGLTWGTAETLNFINDQWRNSRGTPPPQLLAAAKIAGLVWQGEKGAGSWLWSNTVVPTYDAVENFTRMWAEEINEPSAAGWHSHAATAGSHPFAVPPAATSATPGAQEASPAPSAPSQPALTAPRADQPVADRTNWHVEADAAEVLDEARHGIALFHIDQADMPAQERDALTRQARDVFHAMHELRQARASGRSTARIVFDNAQEFDGANPVQFTVIGHTDPTGSIAHNLTLAKQRGAVLKRIYLSAAKAEGVGDLVTFQVEGQTARDGVPNDPDKNILLRYSSADGLHIKTAP